MKGQTPDRVTNGGQYQQTNLLHETHVLPGATDGDGREKQLSDGVGRRLQCGDHLPVKT